MAKESLGELTAVDLREVWEDEARDFTPWLARPENIAALSRQLGDLELEVEGVEVPVGVFKSDIVALDTLTNTKVIIENQLDKTNHDHLGKIITYASGLGAGIVVWISREFTEEHRQAIDFLNEKVAPNMRFYGIEMKLLKIGNSLPAPDFRVVARPNEYVASVNSEKRGMTETKALYLDFWNGFKDHCTKTKTSLSLRKPRPQHWYSIAVGRSKFQISLTASTMYNRIGCEIYIRGVNAKKAFKLLEQDRNGIEEITGKLEWQELKDGQDCRIVQYRQNVNIGEKTSWIDAFDWLKGEAETFFKAFSQRIKTLPIKDEDEDGEEKE
ncbi:MAG: DUF4268 domain-containing protein [Elusimicrobia bacterium]|nr:DUF4268 domain-containing protein [Elusimicrobiota bacterium]